jgi:hypothetical protein
MIRDLLCNTPAGTKKKQELDAVTRLLCGVEWLESDDWVRSLAAKAHLV